MLHRFTVVSALVVALAAASAGATLAGPGKGGQRSDETPLTGDTLTKVSAVATPALSGGTVVRAETDADGVAKYEAHMKKADGSPLTVYVDAHFKLVKGVARNADANRGPRGPRRRHDETPP